MDYVIPANDDATKSIDLITGIMVKAIGEGLAERKVERENEAAAKKDRAAKKEEAKKSAAKKVEVKQAPEASAEDSKTE